MLRDAEYFRSKITKLDGAGEVGDYVVSVVNNKAGPVLNDNGTASTSVPKTPQTTDGVEDSKT